MLAEPNLLQSDPVVSQIWFQFLDTNDKNCICELGQTRLEQQMQDDLLFKD